ncbi:MAG: lysine transporter LysE, partial [Bacteroidota bacterium]|nr:lysine transporter LysE [Bacteroidota bacterium]
MEFSFQIDILGLILKGLLIGVIASAPMGPVGILCIQRTLN